MKLIIDVIEDIRTAIGNDAFFTLSVMGLKEQENGEYSLAWQSDISHMKLDEKEQKLFLFPGRDEPISIGDFLQRLNALSNEAMMYEVCVSYSKEEKRIDTALIGFGESVEDKKYLLFIPDIRTEN